MLAVLRFIRELLTQSRSAPPSQYRTGYQHGLEDVEEWIVEQLWEGGEGDEDE